MPSTSPGHVNRDAPTASSFSQIFPGTPNATSHGTAVFTYRFRRYIAYISGTQLNVLSGPTTLVQAVAFSSDLVAVAADTRSGKLAVASKEQAWVLEPVTEGWARIWWEKTLLLRFDTDQDTIGTLSWSNEGEVLLGGCKTLSLFSVLPSSRTSSPRTSDIDGETIEDRRPLWSKPLAAPVQQAIFSPSSTLVASCTMYGRLVKIWRRLSFEEGLFDHTYLPHPEVVTHIQWRPLDENSGARRGSSISRRHEDEPEVLFTIASDGSLRVWRTGSMHDLDILVLYTSVDLVAAIPESPSLCAGGKASAALPARYAVVLPSEQFSAAMSAAVGLPTGGKVSHSKELLKELISKDMDVILAFDGQGRMSAWGIQSIGHKRRPETPTTPLPFHIAHAEGLQLRLPQDSPALSIAWFQDDEFHLLMHSLVDRRHISWWQGSVEAFFSPSAAGSNRLSQACSWTGKTLADWNGAEQKTQNDAPTHDDRGDGNEVLHRVQLNVPLFPWQRQEKRMLTVSRAGRLAVVNEPSSTQDATSSVVDSGVGEPSAVAAGSDFAALVSEDLRSVTIVDLVDGYAEPERHFEEDITHVECASPRARQGLLAVGHATSVEILAQGRYVKTGPSWHAVKKISLAGLGVIVRGLAWKGDGRLAIRAGNGLFVSSSLVDYAQLENHVKEALAEENEENLSTPLPHFAFLLQQPLPVWHPSVLEELVYHGRADLAVASLKKLAHRLKFWSVGEELDALLDEDVLRQLKRESLGSTALLDADTTKDLKEQLDEKRLPLLSRSDQRRLQQVIDTVAYLCDHVRGLDANAVRYLFAWKRQLIEHQEQNAQSDCASTSDGIRSHEPSFVPNMQWREIAFAYQSTTQQPLLDLLVLHHDNKLTWSDARRLGITSWLSDREALVTVFEQLAQTAYRSQQPPDPVDAAIYYLALHKKQTLVALWRIATWHKEQRTTVNFLKKDFSQIDARTAAKKNAYALMGKRRFHYSAAFFLLADDAASACNVLAGQCEDVHFAIAVARLYCGDGSHVLRKLLIDRILPEANEKGDRWTTSWCYSVLLEKEKAAKSLVEPLSGVKRWHCDDPATLLLYHQLRKTTFEHEYAAVLRSARLLRRMGLTLLTLDLVSTWKFVSRQNTMASADSVTDRLTNGLHSGLPIRTGEPESPKAQLTEPPSLLDDFTSPEPTRSAPKDDLESREAKAAALLAKIKAKKGAVALAAPEVSEKKKPEPTQFKEPDANSLLDSFGF